MSYESNIALSKGGIVTSSKGGVQALAADPADSSLLVRQGGKYSLATLEGRHYGVSNQAAVAVTAAFAATFTGLAVGNPTGSGVNCVLTGMGISNTVIGVSVGSVGIMGGISNLVPITGTLNIQNMKLDGPVSKCTASAGQTINAAPAPTLLKVLAITGTAAVNTWYTRATFIDLDGSIVIPPGYFWATYCFMLATASLQFSFTWEEVPIANLP